MGNTCGGVAGNCCSNESNVDLQGQVEGGLVKRSFMNGYNSGIRRPKETLNLQKIMEMPKNSAERTSIEKMVTKVNALIRGHVQRCQFKKYQFLFLVTGKKPHQLLKEDLRVFPSSKVLMVKLKEQ